MQGLPSRVARPSPLVSVKMRAYCGVSNQYNPQSGVGESLNYRPLLRGVRPSAERRIPRERGMRRRLAKASLDRSLAWQPGGHDPDALLPASPIAPGSSKAGQPTRPVSSTTRSGRALPRPDDDALYSSEGNLRFRSSPVEQGLVAEPAGKRTHRDEEQRDRAQGR